MNKKVMALAVAGAFAAPTAALAQASSVQIFGTMYVEYAYAHQGAQVGPLVGGSPSPQGDLINVDILQTPGSEIGFKGEEALGGGTTAWFQCTSTADFRGNGTGAGTQGFCGRNSALGIKGAWGNVYIGNWDMPMKKTAGAVRIVSDTGIWGAGPMLFGNSSTFNSRASATSWSRRQNNSIFYDSPVFAGFQVFFGMDTLTSSAGVSNNTTGAKPRMWGLAANYTNGPLLLTAGYESHQNFYPATGAILANQVTTAGATITPVGLNATQTGTDIGWQLGASYRFGPVKAGVLYTKQKYDAGVFGAGAAAVQLDASVSAWNLAGEWAIVGPHALRGGYTKANNTSISANGFNALGVAPGAVVPVLVGNRVYTPAGATGGSIWQIQYVYNASKRTEFTVGYVALQNDSNARYALGGLTAPNPGANQNAFAISMKNTF